MLRACSRLPRHRDPVRGVSPSHYDPTLPPYKTPSTRTFAFRTQANKCYRQVRRLAALHRPSKKRKTPDSDNEVTLRPPPFLSPLYRTPSSDRSTSVASTVVSSNSSISTENAPVSQFDRVLLYNGAFDIKNGYITALPVSPTTRQASPTFTNETQASHPDIPKLDVGSIPTPEMAIAIRELKCFDAEIIIRAAYIRKLNNVPGPKIHLTNTIDGSSPPLRFRFINDYVLREGVYKADPATQVGCKSCSPHMGRSIGCEYTKKCDCLEYAAVDEGRLDDEQKRQYAKILEQGGSTMGLPKKFPYYAEGIKTQKPGCLVGFYLNSRRPIYECNDNCKCGPHCRNKNVQFGRKVELEIFKTPDRGWALRCREDLTAGQFIDTYRGEIITDAEATRREDSASSKAKASYLYSLDKFAESEGLAEQDIYVVDGEFMGGPTRFMNHSCEANCRQYTVSYNKHDCRVYDIAFFASRDIPRGEELTFDYLDKEPGEEVEEPEDGDAVPCLCGSKKCRKSLWT
jgi:[histone H3]-lysine9 N-trimethyltransferase SUV39H